MNRYVPIIFSAILLFMTFFSCQVLAASIREKQAEIGYNCTASGDYSTAMGNDTTASGYASTAMGCKTEASGHYSTAMGCLTIAGGYMSFAGGYRIRLTNTAASTFVWGYSDSTQTISTDNAFLIFPAGTAGKVGIGTKAPKCLIDSRDENTSFDSSGIGDLQLLIGNNAASTSGGKAAIGFAVSNSIDSDNIFCALITHTPEDSYSNGGLEFWTKDTNTSTMTLTEKMRIDRNGNVGIGTPSPSKKLYVNGSAGGTQTWNASDKREKTDIKPIRYALNNVSKLRGVAYKWKRGNEDESQGFDNKIHFGVIAQELEEVYPELVDNPGNTQKRKHVEYNGLIGVLIKAVKELKVQNEDQKAKIEAQQSQIKELRSLIQNLNG